MRHFLCEFFAWFRELLLQDNYWYMRLNSGLQYIYISLIFVDQSCLVKLSKLNTSYGMFTNGYITHYSMVYQTFVLNLCFSLFHIWYVIEWHGVTSWCASVTTRSSLHSVAVNPTSLLLNWQIRSCIKNLLEDNVSICGICNIHSAYKKQEERDSIFQKETIYYSNENY